MEIAQIQKNKIKSKKINLKNFATIVKDLTVHIFVKEIVKEPSMKIAKKKLKKILIMYKLMGLQLKILKLKNQI